MTKTPAQLDAEIAEVLAARPGPKHETVSHSANSFKVARAWAIANIGDLE